MNFLNSLTKKEKITLISILVITLAIPVGMYLAGKTQIFKPKASVLTCTSDQTGQPVSQTCIDGVKFLVYEYAESGQCKLFYEAVTGSCTDSSPTPPSSGSPTPPPSGPTPTPTPTATPTPIQTATPTPLTAVCKIIDNVTQARVGEAVRYRVDAEGGIKPYQMSWGGNDVALQQIGDSNLDNISVVFTSTGVKRAVVRVRDQSNKENLPQCPSVDVVDPTASSSPTASPSGGNTIPGDLNSDNKVNLVDFSILLSKWGSGDTVADINKDGTVNIRDYSILFSNWTR